jgi:hypothetical protein
MANEQALIDNWGQAFHDSPEYQAALKRDAIAKSTQESSARQAIQAALRTGDTRRASSIQQQMLDRQSVPGTDAAGLDAYQTGRVANYVAKTRQSGQAEAQRLRQAGSVGTGPDYLAGLDNPDFANQHPWETYRPRPGGMVRGQPQEPPTEPSTLPNGQPVPTPDMLKWNEQDHAAAAVANIRREKNFVASLPPDLADAYAAKKADMTPFEAGQFWNMSPEARNSALRQTAMARAPRTPGRVEGSTVKPAAMKDYLPESGSLFIGSGGLSPMPNISRSVTNVRPTAEVQPVGSPDPFEHD